MKWGIGEECVYLSLRGIGLAILRGRCCCRDGQTSSTLPLTLSDPYLEHCLLNFGTFQCLLKQWSGGSVEVQETNSQQETNRPASRCVRWCALKRVNVFEIGVTLLRLSLAS
jgi:hypothetical protein